MEGIDLALRGGRMEDSSLVARRIFPGVLGIFAAPAYLERRGRPRNVADLARHDCLSLAGCGEKFPWRLVGPRGDETVLVSGPIVCGDMLFLSEMVLRGLGLALLPSKMFPAEEKDGRLVRVLPRYGLPGGGLHIVWPSRALAPARVAVVRELLATALAGLAPQAATASRRASDKR